MASKTAGIDLLPIPATLDETIDSKVYFKFDFKAGTFRPYKDKACTKFKRTYKVSDVKACEPSIDNPKKLKLRAVASEDGKEHKMDIIFRAKGLRRKFQAMLHYLEAMQDPNFDPKATNEKISVFVGTWNVGNAPPQKDLSSWILKDKYDIYVVGVQECKYDAREGYKNCSEDWAVTLEAHIGDKYERVHYVSMWQIRLGVYVRKSLKKHVSGVTFSSEATGIGSMLGNKGGVGISFEYKGNSFCFINSHLAAHQEMIEARNEDVQEIIDNIKIGTKKAVNKTPDICTAFRHLFWMGDLNYRIESDSRVAVCKEIKAGNLEKLYKLDQLSNQMEKENVFVGFTEGPVFQFTPTYKFDRGTRENYSEDRDRVPSWCDRVLWTSWPGCEVKQTMYKADHKVMTSDHSPVHAGFDIDILLPNYPQSKCKPCKIVLTELEAVGLTAMDGGKKADPYLKVKKGLLFLSSGKTKVVKKSTNPKWSGALELEPYASQKEFLETQHLEVEAWDDDKMSKNDLIGRCVLSLKGYMGTKPVAFSAKLRKHGLFAGTLSGKISLVPI